MESKTFNIIGLAIALLCVIVFVTIVIALSHANRRTTQPYSDSKQLRGVHMGLVIFAQSNKSWFPGVSPTGEAETLAAEQRFQILLEGDYFTPEYALSPSETEMKSEWAYGTPVTADNYSYAMLQVPEAGGRRDEWKETLNSQAIVVSDRNTGTKANPSSIHVDQGEGWSGHVLWNDNHVGYENIDEFETKYGSGELNPSDKLFEASGDYDALLVATGNQ